MGTMSTHQTWWQVDRDDAGNAVRVWVNKPTGASAGLWTFEPMQVDGRRVIQVVKSAHDQDGLSATPVGTWNVPEELRNERIPGNTTMLAAVIANYVGWRTGEGVIRRLYAPASRPARRRRAAEPAGRPERGGSALSAEEADQLLTADVATYGSGALTDPYERQQARQREDYKRAVADFHARLEQRQHS